MEEEYVIEVPSHAKKEDLHDLKAFLMSEPRGYISVYIYLQGQKIDTKMKIGVLEQLENWIQEKWGPNNQARF
ncbi:MAG: hypothetical protein H6767_06065 [Candidatus Peribacteria bacterium]|nr:MAG: hypothetical protein H6767_06065 [Candidatus Peribacteria bacterium]